MPPKKKKREYCVYNHQIGFWPSGKKNVGRFESLTTFGMRLLKHVKAPPDLEQQVNSGFIVEVTQQRSQRDSCGEKQVEVLRG